MNGFSKVPSLVGSMRTVRPSSVCMMLIGSGSDVEGFDVWLTTDNNKSLIDNSFKASNAMSSRVHVPVPLVPKWNLILLLSLYVLYPTLAFSIHTGAPFKKTSAIFLPSKSMQSKHGILLRIPRGGDEEQIVDLDEAEATEIVENSHLEPEEEIMVPEPLPESVNQVQSMTVGGVLSPVIMALQCLGTSYSSALGAYPIITKSITAGLTFFLSDYTAQKLEKPKDDVTVKGKKVEWKYNWTRTLVSLAVGLFYFGPAAHAWYEMIFKLLPSTSLFSTLQKAILGQLIFGPTFTSVFFATALMQSGDFTLGNWAKKIKTELPGVWLSGVGYWPLVDFISFLFVPIKYIPLFVNIFSYIWTVYLSVVANRQSKAT